jgi:LysM repeat protein
MMKIRFGRGRHRPSPAGDHFDEVRALAGMPAGDMPYAGDLANGSLVDRYADRLIRAEHLAPPSGDQETQEFVRAEPIGRGTIDHAVATGHAEAAATATFVRSEPRSRRGPRESGVRDTLRERLIAASLAMTLFLTGFAGTASAQQRYLVQPGDTLESVAAEFGVDPEAILRASWVTNPPLLTPGDVIIIPDPGQTPEEAALEAAENVGHSPWTVAAYSVQAGDSIESIAAVYGVDPEDLLAINGLTWSDMIYPGDRLVIPGTGEEGSGAGEQGAASIPSLDTYVSVPTHHQERPLSCEYASVFIATSAFGNPIAEQEYIDSIPVEPNPHLGYRGDIDGAWGNDTDYGIYPEPLVPILNGYGFAAEVMYTDGDPTLLKAHLDAGHPVLIWLAFWGNTGRMLDDDGRYTVFVGMHVMVAYGYNDDGVAFSDPGAGTYRFLDWETFLGMWEPIDGMALAVYPD